MINGLINALFTLAQFLIPAFLIAWADTPRPSPRKGR
jgi:hypothetical protein